MKDLPPPWLLAALPGPLTAFAVASPLLRSASCFSNAAAHGSSHRHRLFPWLAFGQVLEEAVWVRHLVFYGDWPFWLLRHVIFLEVLVVRHDVEQENQHEELVGLVLADAHGGVGVWFRLHFVQPLIGDMLHHSVGGGLVELFQARRGKAGIHSAVFCLGKPILACSDSVKEVHATKTALRTGINLPFLTQASYMVDLLLTTART